MRIKAPLFLFCIITQVAIASRNVTRMESTNTSPSALSRATAIHTEEESVTPTVTRCEGTAALSSKVYPQSFFSEFMINPKDKIELSKESENSIKIKLPQHIYHPECGDFSIKTMTSNQTGNMTIEIGNTLGKTYSQFVDCLKSVSVINNNGINHNASGAVVSESTFESDHTYEAKSGQSVMAAILYPKAFELITGEDQYRPVKVLENKMKGDMNGRCFKVEAPLGSTGPLYFNRGKDEHVESICDVYQNASSIDQVAAMKKTAGNYTELKGNLPAIMAMLDKKILAISRDDMNKNLARIKVIVGEMDKDRDRMPEDKARQLMKELASLSEDISKNLMDPAIRIIKKKLEQREKITNKNEIAKIDEEICELNKLIGEYKSVVSSNGVNPGLRIGIIALVAKYALTDDLKTIEDIRAKSFGYSRVYKESNEKGRSKSMTLSEANEYQVKSMARVELVAKKYDDEYAVKNGDKRPYLQAQRERVGMAQKMTSVWNNYVRKEQEDYQRYCGIGMTGGVTNPVACDAFGRSQASRRARVDKEMTRIKKAVVEKDMRISSMGKSYQGYLDKKHKEEEKLSEESIMADYAIDPTDDSDTDLLIDPSYSTSGAYAPSQYTMLPGMVPAQQQRAYYNPGMVQLR